jgi:amino acid transporter
MSMEEVVGPFGAPVPDAEAQAQLLHDELSLFDSTAVAVSSVAPAYSIASAFSAVFVIVGVGLARPAVIIYSFVPVLFVAISYFHLNRRNPNCGASYSWLSEVVHPSVGWFNGWIQVATSAPFCATAPLLAGQYTLQFVHSAFGVGNKDIVNNVHDIAILAAGWLALVTFICIYGIRWTTNFQWILVIIEYVCVIGFSIGGIIKALVHHPEGAAHFSMNWLSPLSVHGWGALTSGLALGVFFFWGWDTALNLNEESKDASRIPGRAGILSMWLLLFVFLLNFVAAQMLLTPKEIADQGTQVLFYFGQQFAGSWASYVMIFAVLTSTVATTQTTLLPAARITYAMSRDGVFPRIFGSIHEKFKTPAIGTALVSFISLFIIMVTALSAGAYDVLINTLYAEIGVLIAFYYGITGLACAWAFRRTLGQGFRSNVTMILMPLVGGVVLLYTCYYVIRSGGMLAIWDDVILLAGLPLLAVTWFLTRNKPFFRQQVVSYDTLE